MEIKKIKSSPIFKISYDISNINYRDVNRMIFNNFITNKRKKGYITGSILIVMSIFLVTQTYLLKRYDQYILDFLIGFIFITGVFDIIFYKYILPKNLDKQSIKSYDLTRFSTGSIVLNFFEDYIIENSKEGEKIFEFDSISEKFENNDSLVFITDKKELIIIDKSKVSDELLYYINGKLKIINS